MTDRTDALVVGGILLLGWVAAVTATNGWSHPVIAVWALLLFAVAGGVLWWDGPGPTTD